MSGDHAKREMETGDKPTTSHGKASLEESRKKGKGKEKKASSHKSHRSGDKKKKMRKVVYYETDISSPSTSGSDAPSAHFFSGTIVTDSPGLASTYDVR